eukprot:TRINITY_DN7145_c0_g1_i1.p2 TRINITY_DN7145_c0_g1~~TRINITY_DN7145_c0_g1_i1.p2  ORF type:complete len:159 (+),score=79.11 TRINITY_DN7145_c0_g1_i1:86-562(+)
MINITRISKARKGVSNRFMPPNPFVHIKAFKIVMEPLQPARNQFCTEFMSQLLCTNNVDYLTDAKVETDITHTFIGQSPSISVVFEDDKNYIFYPEHFQGNSHLWDIIRGVQHLYFMEAKYKDERECEKEDEGVPGTEVYFPFERPAADPKKKGKKDK